MVKPKPLTVIKKAVDKLKSGEKIAAIKYVRKSHVTDLYHGKEFTDYISWRTGEGDTPEMIHANWCYQCWDTGCVHKTPKAVALERAEPIEKRKAVNHAAKPKAKIAAEEKHQPGKRPVLEAIFGHDWQRIVMEKVGTLEGQRWLNRRSRSGAKSRIASLRTTTSTVWTASRCCTPSFRG
jgi:hypothetical protein